MTLIDDLHQAGVDVSSDEHYLLFEATPESLAILNQYPDQKRLAGLFRNMGGRKELWIDIPFNFEEE